MIRAITFLVIMGLVLFSIWRISKTSPHTASQPEVLPKPELPKRLPLPKAKKLSLEEIWAQVYDTNDLDEAKKIQKSFLNESIACLIYQQGKKNVYGEELKHYGLSVPKENIEHAQSTLAKINL